MLVRVRLRARVVALAVAPAGLLAQHVKGVVARVGRVAPEA